MLEKYKVIFLASQVKRHKISLNVIPQKYREEVDKEIKKNESN